MIQSLINFMREYGYLGNMFSAVSILVGWVILIYHNFWHKTVSLQIGKYRFKVKRKNFNSTDLTNIVSTLYFDGKTIDGELRQEIFKITGTTGKIINDNE